MAERSTLRRCCFRTAVFGLLVLFAWGCKEREQPILAPSPKAANAALALPRVDEERARRAVEAFSRSMQQAALNEDGSIAEYHLIATRSATPSSGCTHADPACVWRFDIRVRQEGVGHQLVEICEVHAYAGTVRCGARRELGGGLLWSITGNAHALPVDAGTH